MTIDMATGTAQRQSGPVSTIRFADLPARSKTVEIWLPHNETTELVALRTDAPLELAVGTKRDVWLHHGSSISQGSGAESPSRTWPALAASLGGVDLINLGFSGSALLDQYVARAMRDTPADLISIKMGINLVNSDVMRLRAFTSAMHGFLDTVRDGHSSGSTAGRLACLLPDSRRHAWTWCIRFRRACQRRNAIRCYRRSCRACSRS